MLVKMLQLLQMPVVIKLEQKHTSTKWSLALVEHTQKHDFCMASHLSDCVVLLDGSLQSVDLTFIFYCLNQIRTLRRQSLKSVEFIAIVDEIGNPRKNTISCHGYSEPLLYDNRKIEIQVNPSESPVCYRTPTYIYDCTLTLEARLHTACRFRETIDKYHQPPSWGISTMQKLPIFTSTLIFYDDNATSDELILLQQIKQLYHQRQPACINMAPCFDKELFLSAFGFQSSFYEQFFNSQNSLPANIGIYSLAYVSKTHQHTDIPNEEEILSLLKEDPPLHKAPMHFYIASGYTFTPNHPDTLYFTSTNDTNKRIHSAFACVFKKLFTACLHKDLTHICMPPIGLSSNSLTIDILPAWLHEFASIHNFYFQSGITVSLMHCEPHIHTQITTYCPMMSYIKTHTSLFSSIGILSDNQLATTLFVSEMDPIAYPGNGFLSDLSTNAKIGASTTLWLTANGMINPIHDSSFVCV